MKSPNILAACALLALTSASTPLLAQVVPAPAKPVVGSSNPVTPEPNVPRPSTTPCTGPRFQNLAFTDYSAKPLSFTPSRACAGPWSKVVLTADFTVTAGRQYDRTANIFLGNTNLYFGTTAEPRAKFSPSWHVERDLTDLSALFHNRQTGAANLGNTVNSTYTGIVYGTAKLLFYPADAANPAPAVPSAVIGLNTGNSTTFVNTTTDAQSLAVTFPRNTERVFLDVISQSQASDEFWYTCVPNSAAGPLQNCGNTGFRETEVAVDGKPAGVAPVYPWIYTGGLDPYLWEPITGIETLNLKPYRVDLSPFAGLLADGKPHTVAVSVFNANTGFSIASNLLVYTDPNSLQTSGALTADTLSLTPNVQQQVYIGTADGTVSGPVDVYQARAWMISGYVNTSHGRVDTTLQASNTFKNNQTDVVSSTVYKQEIFQETTQQEVTTTTSPGGQAQVTHNIDWPLTVNYNYAPTDSNNGDYFQTSYVKQGKYDEILGLGGPNNQNPIVSNETVETSDTLNFPAAGPTTHTNTHSTSTFSSKDQNFSCYYRRLTADNLVLTNVEDSNSCSYAP